MMENLVLNLISNKVVPTLEMVQGDTREIGVRLPHTQDMNFPLCQMAVQSGGQIKLFDGIKRQDLYTFEFNEDIKGKCKIQFYFYGDEQKTQRVSSFPYEMVCYEREWENV